MRFYLFSFPLSKELYFLLNVRHLKAVFQTDYLSIFFVAQTVSWFSRDCLVVDFYFLNLCLIFCGKDNYET